MERREAIELAFRLRAECKVWNRNSEDKYKMYTYITRPTKDVFFVKVTTKCDTMLHADAVIHRCGLFGYWIQMGLDGIEIVITEEQQEPIV
jgi:hypothetical protein